jgi:glycosyltransferase involved in cell wall biosynthesis
MALARTRNFVSLIFKSFYRLYSRGMDDYLSRYDEMVRMLHLVDIVHCISNVQATRVQKATGTLKNLNILPLIPPGVDGCRIRERTGSAGGKLNFCVLNVQPGRDDKGYSFLKKTFEMLEANRQDFSVDWYAEGIDSGCVKFRGKYRQADLDAIAERTDYCIIPSIWLETLAFTGVEMLYRGVPLICSKRAGVSEWIDHGKTGVVFDPTYPDVLVNVLDSLIDESFQAKAMRETIAKSIATKSYKQHLEEFEAMLVACLKRN